MGDTSQCEGFSGVLAGKSCWQKIDQNFVTFCVFLAVPVWYSINELSYPIKKKKKKVQMNKKYIW